MWTLVDDSLQKFRGLSTDTKPAAAPGSEFLEMDTGKTYLYDAEGTQWTEQPASGGGGNIETVKPSDVNFYDCDGNRRYAYTAEEFAALEEMPKNPAYPGLTPQGWNWTLAGAKTHVAANGGLNVGQTYITDDQKTRFYLKHGKGTVYICGTPTVANDIEQDWGVWQGTGGWVGGINEFFVYYGAAGEHVVTFLPKSGSMSFGGNSSSSVFSTSISTVANYGRRGNIRRIEIGKSVAVPGDYAFQSALVDHIVLPKFSSVSALSIGARAFRYCYALQALVVPSGIGSIGSNAFDTCNSIKRIILPEGITSLGQSAFVSCYSLEFVDLPGTLTAISQSCFENCYSLRKVTVPASVTSIAAYAFKNCTGVMEYHMKRTTPPTLVNSNAFDNFHTDCRIYVPKSENEEVLNAYKAASNWSTYADKMREEPK